MQPQPSLMSQLSSSMAAGGSPMDVQTPGAPGFQPQLQTPQPIPMPQGSPASMLPGQGQLPPQAAQMAQGQPQGGQEPMVTIPGLQDGDPQQTGVQLPESEASLIIKALDGRMKALSKIHGMAAQAAFPQPQQPAQA